MLAGKMLQIKMVQKLATMYAKVWAKTWLRNQNLTLAKTHLFMRMKC